MEQQSNNDLIHQYLMANSGKNGDPVLFKNMIADWPASMWTIDNLQSVFESEPLRFRIGNACYKGVQWENECSYEMATVAEFQDWLMHCCKPENPLLTYDRSKHWCYADYKYMAKLFAAKPDVLKMVDWSAFGFIGRDGTQSTFWLGSQGANTVCHYDTYGCNLVAQIHGRKRWVLYPPSQTRCMYSTRIPYEESSVFSQVNVSSPDLRQHPLYKEVTPWVVVLEPGDVLFVPRHWWHYVESLDTSISINTWIELAEDDAERVREAVARTLAMGLMSEDFTLDLNYWLNPTEEATDHESNMSLIRASMKMRSTNRHKTGAPASASPQSHFKPSADYCTFRSAALRNTAVRPIPRSNFDDLCRIYPCREPSSPDHLPQRSGDEADEMEGRNRTDSLSKIDSLCTADIVKILLQPTVLDSIVTELEKNFLAG